MRDLERLSLDALQSRVRRGTIKPTGRRNKKCPMFTVEYLEKWLSGALEAA